MSLRNQIERAIESTSDGIHTSQDWWAGLDGTLAKTPIEHLLDSIMLHIDKHLEQQTIGMQMAIRHWSKLGCDADVTCLGCSARNVCELAWDPYNTDGDCLMEK